MSGEMEQVAVIGGGLTGLAAAVASARAGLQTVHIALPVPPDRRTSALMAPSVDYLRQAGLVVDPATAGTPLRRIRLIDATNRLLRAPEALFSSSDAGLEAFGWNFANLVLSERFAVVGANLPNLRSVAGQLATAERREGAWDLRLADGIALRVPLLIGADGKRSTVRAAAGIRTTERNYSQAALVCDLELARSLEDTSVEFHYPDGPFTLVPAGERSANLVWIDRRDVLQRALGAEVDTLRIMLAEKSQRLFGRIEVLGPAQMFPLSTLTVDVAGKAGALLVGEAAHAFPPIGAQGLNLGLRDVADLAVALGGFRPGEPDEAERISEVYARRRAGDLARTTATVSALFGSLLSSLLPAQLLRSGGMWALKSLPPLRRQAFAIGMGRS